MKPWTKIEIAIPEDKRIDTLINQLGMKGFGIYMILRIYADCLDYTVEQLKYRCSEYCSRRMFDKVLQEFDLFKIDAEGHVSSRICTRASAHASAHASVREIADVPLPLEIVEKEKLERETKESSEESDAVADGSELASEPMGMGTVEGMAALLCREQIWRESLLTTRPSARDMLEEDFDFCMRFALQCSLSLGKDELLQSLQMTKKYIGNYLGNPDCVARLRNAYIREHQQTEDERLTYDQLALHYPHLQELSEPLTKKQLDDLIARHGTPTVSTAMKALNNFADLHKRYTSAFYAIETWSKK